MAFYFKNIQVSCHGVRKISYRSIIVEAEDEEDAAKKIIAEFKRIASDGVYLHQPQNGPHGQYASRALAEAGVKEEREAFNRMGGCRSELQRVSA